jgi:hypothetical protein
MRPVQQTDASRRVSGRVDDLQAAAFEVQQCSILNLARLLDLITELLQSQIGLLKVLNGILGHTTDLQQSAIAAVLGAVDDVCQFPWVDENLTPALFLNGTGLSEVILMGMGQHQPADVSHADAVRLKSLPQSTPAVGMFRTGVNECERIVPNEIKIYRADVERCGNGDLTQIHIC